MNEVWICEGLHTACTIKLKNNNICRSLNGVLEMRDFQDSFGELFNSSDQQGSNDSGGGDSMEERTL